MAEFKQELERLTEQIAAERQRIRSQAQKPAPALNLQRCEPGNAQNISAAQRRAPAAMRNDPCERQWLKDWFRYR
jgi:hypothetical protein